MPTGTEVRDRLCAGTRRDDRRLIVLRGKPDYQWQFDWAA